MPLASCLHEIYDDKGVPVKPVIVTHGHQVQVTDRTLGPLQPGEALLQMKCCVCHTALHVKNGDFGGKTGVMMESGLCGMLL